MKQYKALALISGGLDSLLAAKTIQAQGIHVEGINFYTGFCVEGHTHAIRKKDQKKKKRNNALWVAETLDMPLHIIDVIEEYKQVVYQPKFGYGKHLNPCLDCKVFMVGKALEWIKENDFDFIITGEVVGQRPKSQRRETMNVVKNESHAEDRLLRPLCAKLLAPTLPEREGWVDREKLHDFQGRGRHGQMALAKQYGFSDYAQPSGGCCFLTDKSYSAKLHDLWQAHGSKQYELDDIMLLKVGRHLRPKPNFKVIIGREEGENNFLHGYRKQFIHIKPLNGTGPLMLIDGNMKGMEDFELAVKLLGRFCKILPTSSSSSNLIAEVHPIGDEKFTVEATPMKPEDVPSNWYLDQKEFSNKDCIPTDVVTNA